MVREPEMVKAYRDTWELGTHSYPSYLRDRLLLARELLHESGSIFVQISDENLHRVRHVMDEVFRAENFLSIITVVKTSAQEAETLPSVCDYLLWYGRNGAATKYRRLWLQKEADEPGTREYNRLHLPDGTRRRMTVEEQESWVVFPIGAKAYRQDNIVSQRPPGDFPVEFESETYRPLTGYWKTGIEGMERLIQASRIEERGRMLSYVRFFRRFSI